MNKKNDLLRGSLIIIISMIRLLSYSQDTISKNGVTYSIKNLNVSTFKDGTPIIEAVNETEWIRLNNEKKPAFCYYNYKKDNDFNHGKLYNYWAMISPLGIAPEGWHIPNIYEMEAAFCNTNAVEAEIKNSQLSKYDKDYLPYPFKMYIKDGILSKASSICEKSGVFLGTPYNKTPNYNWWSGAWWVNTSYKEKGLIALKVKSMTQSDAVEAQFEAQNEGLGYSAICFKDYLPTVVEKYNPVEITKNILSFQSKNLDVEKLKDGTPILEATSPEQWVQYNKEKKPAYCYYKYNKNYGLNYGKLYNYWAMISPLGIAPEGWHIPNIYEMEMAINKTKAVEAEIKNSQLRKYDEDLLPNPIKMYIKDSILSNASGICEESGSFFGTPYNKTPNYNWWSGGWWVNTMFKEKGLIALKVKSMTESDAVDAQFEAQNEGFGYSAICFKDYLPPIFEKYNPVEITKNTVTFRSKNLDVEKFKDGTPILEATSPEQWLQYNKEKKPAYCHYKYNKYYGLTYGKLYNYWAIINPEEIVPEGWHIPNVLELMTVLGKNDIPKNSIKTTGKTAYGDKICNPISKDDVSQFTEIKQFEELAGSNCSANGSFYFTSFNNMQSDKSWCGSWWTSNSIYSNYNTIKPISLKINSNPYDPYTKHVSFEGTDFNDGCSILCFKDYPIDSAELEKNVYINEITINSYFSIIDSITDISSNRKRINVYTNKDGELLTDFLLLGKSYIPTYIKWGKASDYFSNPQFKILINSSLKSGLFLTNFKNIDWLNKKIKDNNKWIDSKFRSFELIFDLSSLPPNEKYYLKIPELNIEQDLIIDNFGLASFNIDTTILDYIERMSYKSLDKTNANKELSFQILNKSNKPFAGIKRYFYTNQPNDKNDSYENNTCKYVEIKNEVVQLQSNFIIDYVTVNSLVHSLYAPLIDSLIRKGKIIEASNAYDKEIRKLLPNYFSGNENEWPNKRLMHKINFDNLLTSVIFNLSSDPSAFVDAFKLADINGKYVFKKAYYYFGQTSNELTKSLLSFDTKTYNNYLLSSLLEYASYFKEPILFGLEKNAFDFKSPVLFKLDQITLPDASNSDESDIIEPLNWVNKAIALEPNNPLGYLYRAKFKGCKKIQVHHDACTVSDWCSNCKDLQKATQLDQNRTKFNKIDLAGFSYIDNLDTDNYYESFYKMECVNCQLCFYNICGGESKSKSIQTGKRGGKYYINKNGNKTYINKN